MRNFVLRVLGWLSLLPYLFVLALVLTGPATWSGTLYALGLGAVVIGLCTLPGEGRPASRRPRGVTRAGMAAVALVAFVRGCTASDGESMHLVSDAGGHRGPARFVDRVLDEGDVAVAGTRVLYATGMLRDDAAEVPAAMRAAYSEMRDAEGDAPSPLVATYLGLQAPSAFDVVVVEPEHRSDTGVIFLHGFAGNFDLPCWQVARAVAPLGLATACPSTRWVGDWWTPDGEAIVRRTLALLRARGVSRVILVGLSNGGYGASRLAPRMPGAFAGLVLVSGAAPDAPGAGIPTLVVHGTKDSMAPVSEARAYAARASARFVGLDAGHFAMLVRAEQSDRALRDFVRAVAGERRADRY